MKIQTIFAVALAASATFAQEIAPSAPATVPVAPVTTTPATVVPAVAVGTKIEEPTIAAAPTASEMAASSVANANEDAEFEPDADAKVQEAFDAFVKSKGSGFPGWGRAYAKSGIIYYCEMEAVNGIGAKDSEFIQKRQTAFLRAYMKIREDFVKFSLNSRIQSTVENSFLKDKEAEGSQSQVAADQVQRLAQKTMALAESELDKKLEDNGISPTQFTTIEAKRKALSQKILATAASHAFSSCAGISVVRTVEGGAADGYTIGVIAKFDPQYVYFADCFARQVRPQPSAAGINVSTLYLNKDISQDFGTRFFYDEQGMPSLISFGQWAVTNPSKDRTERKLQEKAARLQAESQANIDMNNFIAGSMTFDEATAGGEEWSKTISYDQSGCPVASSIDSTLADFVNRSSKTKANLNMGGRDILVSKFVVHPDTKQKIAVAAVGWSFAKLEAQKEVESIIRSKGRGRAEVAPKDEPKTPASPATLREGQTYDF